MKSVLFLDIDGVLNYYNFFREQWKLGKRGQMKEFCPKAVRYLTRILHKTQCDVVISSTWRIGHTVEEIRSFMIASGMPEKNANQIIARNPIASEHSFSKGYCAAQNLAFSTAKWPGRWYRGYESAVWLSKNPGYTGVAIIDDDRDMWYLAENFIHTKWRYGLTGRKAKECVTMLRKDSTALIARLNKLISQDHKNEVIE